MVAAFGFSAFHPYKVYITSAVAEERERSPSQLPLEAPDAELPRTSYGPDQEQCPRGACVCGVVPWAVLQDSHGLFPWLDCIDLYLWGWEEYPGLKLLCSHSFMLTGGSVCGGTASKTPKGWEFICVGRETSVLAIGSLG